MASETCPDDDSETPLDNEDNNESSQLEENKDSSESATPTQQEPATPSSAGLRHFIAALHSTGWQRSALIQVIPGERYYYCEVFTSHTNMRISVMQKPDPMLKVRKKKRLGKN